MSFLVSYSSGIVEFRTVDNMELYVGLRPLGLCELRNDCWDLARSLTIWLVVRGSISVIFLGGL